MKQQWFSTDRITTISNGVFAIAMTLLVLEVKFDALPDEAEHAYFIDLPTSFKLSDEEVDKLRDAAHRILTQSEDFQRFVEDLR